MANQEISPKLWCPEFLLGFHYVGIMDWTIGHVTDRSSLASVEVWLGGAQVCLDQSQPGPRVTTSDLSFLHPGQ